MVALGEKYGRLTVTAHAVPTMNRQRRWYCVCDCGGASITRTDSLSSGITQSCGCLQREKAAATGAKSRTHGMKKSPEYRVWSHLRGRCNNETDARYDNWGGRGIAVCPEWDSFEQFYADMGPRPVGTTIDRKDNSKGYSKENCRWATHTEQTRNRRCSWYIPTAQGMFSTKEYSEHYGLSYHMVRAWVQRRKIFAIQPFAGEPSWSQLR